MGGVPPSKSELSVPAGPAASSAPEDLAKVLSKLLPKEILKDHSKEGLENHSKEALKEHAKEHKKDHQKELPKEPSKELSKEPSKELPKKESQEDREPVSFKPKRRLPERPIPVEATVRPLPRELDANGKRNSRGDRRAGRGRANGAHRNSAEWSVPRESPETSLQSASFGAYGGLPRGLRHEEPRTKTEVRRERSPESERVGGKREKSVGRREGKKPAMEGKGKTKSSVRDSEPRSFNDKAKVNAKAQEQPIAKEEPKEEPKAEVTMQAAEPVRRNPNADAPPFLPREEMAMMYPMVRQPMVYMIPADYYPPMMVPMNDPNMNYNFMYNYNYPPMNQ